MKQVRKHLAILFSLLLALSVNQASADEINDDQAFEHAREAYQAKDYEQARKAFKPLAESGHADAQIYMGSIYDKGLGVARDLQKAMYWFEQSAEQGGVKLQYDLGVRYQRGTDIKKDDAKAVYWWQKAADAGLAQAQYNLALMYSRGTGVDADHDKAVALYRLAAEQGLADAQYALGLSHTLGQGVPLDYDEAYRLFELAAKQGYPSAQYNLAVLTESGEGTEANLDEALVWYRKAAEQGNDLAQQRLAQLESKPVSATISTPAAMVIHDQTWIKKQPASRYTIQINLSQDKEKLVGWLKSLQPLAPLAYYPQDLNGKVVYKAIYGSFESSKAAQKALSELPEELIELKPWVRRFSRVHEQLLND